MTWEEVFFWGSCEYLNLLVEFCINNNPLQRRKTTHLARKSGFPKKNKRKS